MAQMQATGGSFVMLAKGNQSAQVAEAFAETAKPLALTIGRAPVQPRWPAGLRLG